MNEILRLKPSNCKNCYKCIRHCPVKAIRFSAGQNRRCCTSASAMDCCGWCCGFCSGIGLSCGCEYMLFYLQYEIKWYNRAYP